MFPNFSRLIGGIGCPKGLTADRQGRLRLACLSYLLHGLKKKETCLFGLCSYWIFLGDEG
jgi:hypothetical protein